MWFELFASLTLLLLPLLLFDENNFKFLFLSVFIVAGLCVYVCMFFYSFFNNKFLFYYYHKACGCSKANSQQQFFFCTNWGKREQKKPFFKQHFYFMIDLWCVFGKTLNGNFSFASFLNNFFFIFFFFSF